LLTLVAPALEKPPRAVVMVVVDQMPIRLWDRLLPELPPGGLRRLVDGGANFVGVYGHAMTGTGPGHALIATGADAGRSGIVANEWWVRAPWHKIKCDEDAQFGASPTHLRALTVADSLAAATGRRARILALSWKGRGAVFLGGRHPTAALWYDPHKGAFVSSAYYGALPAWVARVDSKRAVGSEWRPSVELKRLAALGGADDAPGEGDFCGLGRVFPHRIASPEALAATPQANDLLLDLALAGAAAEAIGKDAVPDLLTISFSATDFVGHVFGPDSQEAADTFLRLDRTVARLLGWLDHHVGAGRFAVVLTSDHGVASLPERTGGVRMPLDAEIAAAVEKAVGPGHQVGMVHPHLYIEPPDPAALKAARAALSKLRGVEQVFDASELAKPRDSVAQAVARTWDPERSGDLYVILQPHAVFEEDLVRGHGTGHGSPREYDREVPLVFFGAGVRPQKVRERVAQEAIAPTTAALLGVPPPPAATEKALLLGPGEGERARKAAAAP
jgi:hypothetical protein